MDSSHVPKKGQRLVGPLFNEPMLIETVRPGAAAVWSVGLDGRRTHQFRRVQPSENGDCSPYFLRLANPLLALYPKERGKKRLLDALLVAAPR